MDQDEIVTLAVVGARLNDLREEVKADRLQRHTEFNELRDELRQSRKDSVARVEWLARNAFVDQRFIDQGKDITDLKQDIAGRRTPWYAVVGAITGILSVVAIGIFSILNLQG